MAESLSSPTHEPLSDNDVQAIDQLRASYTRLRDELGRVIVGFRSVCSRVDTAF